MPAEMEKKAVDSPAHRSAAGRYAGPPAAPSTTTRTASGTTGATPVPAAFGVLAYSAWACWHGRGAAPLVTPHPGRSQRAGPSGLGLVHPGLALKLMGDDARRPIAPSRPASGSRVGDHWYWWGLRQQPARLGADVRAAARSTNWAGRSREPGRYGGRRDREANRYISTQEKLALPARSQLRQPADRQIGQPS